jgi:hypothetical protein
MIEFIGLLSLESLIDFGGSEPADFVSDVFNLGPRQIGRRTVLAIRLLADEQRQLIQLRQHCRRPLVSASFDFRCHAFVLPRQCQLTKLAELYNKTANIAIDKSQPPNPTG